MPELNETQARNWAKVADAVARKTGMRRLREDLVGSAVLAVLEEPSEDVVDKAVALRQGMRGLVRGEAKERARTAGIDLHGTAPWLAPHDTPHESWLQVLDEEDALSKRIREAYDEDAEAAVAASRSRGYIDMVREHREHLVDVEASIAEERRHVPVYMQPEYRMDHGEVGIALESFDPGYYDIDGAHTHWTDVVRWVEDVEEFLESLGKDAVRYAYKEGLTPPEAAHFVNQVARMVADEAPRRKKGLYYHLLRQAGGDHMALCDPEPRVYLRAEGPYEDIDGKGIVPAGTEVAREAPGATSGYGIEDEDAWMWLFPDGPGGETFELPRGSDDDIRRLIKATPARTRPEDVQIQTSPFFLDEGEWEYQGWQVWHTEEARRAFLKAWLIGLSSWKEAARAGRNAFWTMKGRKRLLARHYKALRAEGLGRDADNNYKVMLRAEKEPAPLPDEYWSWVTAA